MPKAARSSNQIATRFVRLIGKLDHAESLARDWTPACRLRLRSRYSAAVVREIKRRLPTHLHVVAPASLLGEALHYRTVSGVNETAVELDLQAICVSILTP
ncbi:hypothetical protein GmRootV118_02680 [Variovorax sp. V118]|uniref:IS66 family transposase n=1 Tax=Variovorax sp. V118 TaxID=3065954 RepID=UPI0034E87034